MRLRQLTQQNFTIVETIGLVAVARYTFEVSIWLRLFALDQRDGLVYYDQLLDTQERFYRDTLNQLTREAGWLKTLDEKEAAAHEEVLAAVAAGQMEAGAVHPRLNAISAQIDDEAARRFSIYAEAGKANGYGFQAHLVETKAVPRVRKALDQIQLERKGFDYTASKNVKALCPRNWRWRQMAQKVGKVDEYDYLYSFASKLLHATPASITTDQKNLEPQEIRVFLRYIDLTIGDILDLAAAYVLAEWVPCGQTAWPPNCRLAEDAELGQVLMLGRGTV